MFSLSDDAGVRQRILHDPTPEDERGYTGCSLVVVDL
jgi:hypothetical protein